jgi:hypothetical protein
MSENVEKVNLSQATEFSLRNGVTLKVYPASLEIFTLLAPKLKEMDKQKGNVDIEKQASLFVDVVYDLVKDDNQVTKDILKKSLTLEACIKIMQKALGSFGGALVSK